MGACSAKKDNNTRLTKEQQALATNRMTVGPEIFINLRTGEVSQSYQINKILGEGSYGQVRLVTHKTTGQMRAMKQIAKAKIMKEQEQEMFNEVALLKDMDHPNILKLFELYQDDKNYFLVTEYLTGGELLDKVAKTKFLSEKLAAYILSLKKYYTSVINNLIKFFFQISKRDLKPANILFESNDANSNLKIIDFGTAKKIIDGEKQGQVIGTPLYIAPEVINKSYTEKCDIWSVGIILFQLLTGKFPFNVKVQSLQQLFANIKSGKYDWEMAEFKNLSPQAQAFIRKLLDLNPEARPKALDALQDQWISNNNKEDQLNPSILDNIGKFNNENQLRASLMQLIASQVMSNQERQQLQESFQSMDTNKDGSLSKEELTQGYMKVFHDELKAKHIVDEVFKHSDADKSGKISYTEFIVAATEQSKLLSKTKIDQTFKMFDTVFISKLFFSKKDGNGVISIKELQEIMCGLDLDNAQWKSIMQQCDKNGDGQIQKDEFVDLLLKV